MCGLSACIVILQIFSIIQALEPGWVTSRQIESASCYIKF